MQIKVLAVIDTSTLVIGVAVPLTIALIGTVGIIVGATLARWADASNRRRDSYAAAVQTMVAWVEFPYRIRRRTSDVPEEWARLAGLGHDLQERLRCHATWIGAESAPMGQHYQAALALIGQRVADSCEQAWRTAPVTTAAGMIIGQWGPGMVCAGIVDDFQRAVTWRFGARRLVAPVVRLAGRNPYQITAAAPSPTSSGGITA